MRKRASKSDVKPYDELSMVDREHSGALGTMTARKSISPPYLGLGWLSNDVQHVEEVVVEVLASAIKLRCGVVELRAVELAVAQWQAEEEQNGGEAGRGNGEE
jgi:hypothetical protein